MNKNRERMQGKREGKRPIFKKVVYHNPRFGCKNTVLHNSANYVNKEENSTIGCGRSMPGGGIFRSGVNITIL